MILKALQSKVDEQVLVRKGLLKGKIIDLEQEVSYLYTIKVLTWDESDLLLRKLQNVPWQNRICDIFFD